MKCLVYNQYRKNVHSFCPPCMGWPQYLYQDSQWIYSIQFFLIHERKIVRFSLVFHSWLILKKIFSITNDRLRIKISRSKYRLMAQPFNPLKTGSSLIRENQQKVVLCRKEPYIFEFLFITVTRLSRIFLRIVKRYSIHRLQLGFVNVFIAPIRFSYFTTLTQYTYVDIYVL